MSQKRAGCVAWGMNCENCGRPLKSADAECEHCAAELRRSPAYTYSPDPADLADAGPYTCPACSKHFEGCVAVLFPAVAPWWRMQRNALGCPHCKTPLRWVSSYRPSKAIRMWQSAMAGVLLGLLVTLGSAGVRAIQFWWPNKPEGPLAMMAFAVSFFVLCFGGYPQNPYRQLPKGEGHFVTASTKDEWGPDFSSYVVALVLTASVLLLSPKHGMPYVWLLMALLGVVGGVFGIAWAWHARRTVAKMLR